MILATGLVLGIIGTTAARRARAKGDMAAAIVGIVFNALFLSCVGLGSLLALRSALVNAITH